MDAYTETLRRTLVETSSLGDERTQEVAWSLTAALDPALRLVVLQMLTDTADELNSELDGAHVAVVMDGSTPHLLVNQAAPSTRAAEEAEPVIAPPQDVPRVSQEPRDQEGTEVRTTLRLPESLKREIDAAARARGRSVNAWLVEAARGALIREASPSGTGNSADSQGAGYGAPDGARDSDGAGSPSGRPAGSSGRQTSGPTLKGWFG